MLHHQEHRLGRRRAALQARREKQVADLDRTGRGRDAQVARHPDGSFIGQIDDGVEQRIFARRLRDHPGPVSGKIGEGAVGQVRPLVPRGIERIGGVQRLGVARGVERFEPAIAPQHRRT